MDKVGNRLLISLEHSLAWFSYFFFPVSKQSCKDGPLERTHWHFWGIPESVASKEAAAAINLHVLWLSNSLSKALCPPLCSNFTGCDFDCLSPGSARASGSPPSPKGSKGGNAGPVLDTVSWAQVRQNTGIIERKGRVMGRFRGDSGQNGEDKGGKGT